MLVNKSWLEQHLELKTPLSASQMASELKMRTVEVEGFSSLADSLTNVVVGVISTLEKHPDADKLSVCQVDVGTGENVQIVCGGTNLQVGMKVALGKIGASVVWHGEGEPVVLQKTKIRGVESFGMICAAEEIYLGERFPKKDEREILDLSFLSVPTGTPVAEALHLNEVVFDIENKSLSHRPDLWGHRGLAREVSTLFRVPLKTAETKEITPGDSVVIKVNIDQPILCPRYMAVALSGIVVAPSPQWLQDRLTSVGVRPINNVVDVTNYILLDQGQPMHAFDAERVGKAGEYSLTVRLADDKESFVALDGRIYELHSTDLVIANGKKVLALAGVMGGLESSVTKETTNIIFECANFEAAAVRRSSRIHGLRSESSMRFEKNLDPTLPALALVQAVSLLQELCPTAIVTSAVVDEKSFALSSGPIHLSMGAVMSKLGREIEKTEVREILSFLGFELEEKGNDFFVTVPSWRATKDILAKEDLVEEIARVSGFENIPSTLPWFPIVPPRANALRQAERTMKDFLALSRGYHEVYNYSFESADWLKKIGIDTAGYLELENPIAKDRPLIRRILFPGLLENIDRNIRRHDKVCLFEIGRVYQAEELGEVVSPYSVDTLPKQDMHLAFVWSEKGNETPFFSVSHTLSELLNRLNISFQLDKTEPDTSFCHPGRFAQVVSGGGVVGRVTELNPTLQENLGLPYRVAVVEINLEKLLLQKNQPVTYQPLSSFPTMSRDLALVVDQNISHTQLLQFFQSVDPLITGVDLFDVYQGAHVLSGKKSLAYRLTYESRKKTLTTSEVDSVQAKIIQQLEKKFGAVIRQE